MTIDVPLAIGGLFIGVIVGLTGMGGGALTTPMLVFFFHVDPLTAVSSDVVASVFMKPAGAWVHLRRGTVHLGLVAWLCAGSIPAAFIGAWLISVVPAGAQLNTIVQQALGVALLVAATGLVVRAALQMWRRHLPLGEGPVQQVERPSVTIRRGPTVALGAVAGLMVGVTSVGAGSVVIVVLLLLYPALAASSLVGTDLVQAIPLVGSAAAGHVAFGEFSPAVTGSLLVGAIPGTWLGAQVSSRAPGGIVRRVLAVLLLSSGLKLLGAPNEVVLGAAVGAIVGGSLAWVMIKRLTAHHFGTRPDQSPVQRPLAASDRPAAAPAERPEAPAP